MHPQRKAEVKETKDDWGMGRLTFISLSLYCTVEYVSQSTVLVQASLQKYCALALKTKRKIEKSSKDKKVK